MIRTMSRRRRVTAVALAGAMFTAVLGVTLVPSALGASAVVKRTSDNGVGEIEPAPGAFGSDVPVTYQGPPPSETKKELIGQHELLRSGEYDLDKGTVELPLYRGTVEGSDRPVWYILTDTSDTDEADSLGLNFSPKLKYANVAAGAREATLVGDNELRFANGTVDFRPERQVVPGDAPNFFPPKKAEPGSRGSDDYSPIVKVANTDTVYNAPVVSMASDADLKEMSKRGKVDHRKVHDKVVAVDYDERTITLNLTTGFSFARPVLYLSTEASDTAFAAAEGATYAPGMNSLAVGGDDGAFSSVERIFIATNGPTGKENPQRQGLDSALSDGGSPLNVLGGIPTVATDYSPLWDANVYSWTQEAIDKGYRARNFEEFRILGLAVQGHITGLDGEPFGSSGVIINCPVAFRLL